MRRIEAVTGEAAEALVEARLATLEAAAGAAGVQTIDALPARVTELQERIKELEKRLKAGASGGGAPRPGELARAAETVNGIALVAHAGAFPSMDAVKGLAKDVRGSLPSGVIVIALDADEPQLFVTVSGDLAERGIDAGDLVRLAAPAIDGKGGGRPEMAQGRGTRREGLPAALDAIRQRLAS
jgi:alanyl-tRNA synthetase